MRIKAVRVTVEPRVTALPVRLVSEGGSLAKLGPAENILVRQERAEYWEAMVRVETDGKVFNYREELRVEDFESRFEALMRRATEEMLRAMREEGER